MRLISHNDIIYMYMCNNTQKSVDRQQTYTEIWWTDSPIQPRVRCVKAPISMQVAAMNSPSFLPATRVEKKWNVQCIIYKQVPQFVASYKLHQYTGILFRAKHEHKACHIRTVQFTRLLVVTR